MKVQETAESKTTPKMMTDFILLLFISICNHILFPGQQQLLIFLEDYLWRTFQ